MGNRRRDGVKLRLTSDQVAQLATWIEDGPDLERDGVVRWRRVDLARRIEEVFGIKLHERTVGRYLARLGFRRMSVRPEHPKADWQAQAAFKKTWLNLRIVCKDLLLRWRDRIWVMTSASHTAQTSAGSFQGT